MKTKALLFGVALFIRLTALWILPEPHLDTNATIAFLGGAHILLEGKGFSDPSYPLFTPPLYTVFISILWSLFGVDQVSIKLAQALADSVTVVVIYLIVQEIFNVRTALLSGALWAVYPFAIYPTIYIGTETVFTFFLSLFVLLTVYGIKYGKWQYASGAGVMLGLATLTRGTTQFLPFLFPLALFALKKNKNHWLLNYGTFLLAFALVLLPWGLRNYLIFHEFIPVATAGGVFLWGSTEKFLTIEERERELPVFFAKLRSRGLEQPSKGSNPTQSDKYLFMAGIENYKMRLENDPSSLVPFLLKKFLRLWYATESGNNHGLILGINLPVYLLAIIGAVLSWTSKNELSFLLLGLLGYFVLLHWAALPLFRYMVPIMPYVIAFAGFAIMTIMESSKSKYFGLRSAPH